MLIARLIPPESTLYGKIQTLCTRLDPVFDLKLENLFAIWTLFMAGVGTALMMEDRFIYWNTVLDWQAGLLGFGITALLVALFGFLKTSHPPDPSRSLSPRILWTLAATGLIALAAADILAVIPVAVIMLLMGPLSRYKYFEHTARSLISTLICFFLGYLLFLTGWLYHSSDVITGILFGLPYALAYVAAVRIYSIPLVRDETSGRLRIESTRMRLLNLGLGIVLGGAAAWLGYLNDDPVISTAAAVSLPFLLVALVFPEHPRHIQRSRMYPPFILAMFVAVRQPWFLLPLAILFFTLRTCSYFRYQQVHPTFGVETD